MTLRLPRAALIAVGDELLSGATTDLNSPYCAARLTELGFEVWRKVVVGDDEEPLAAVVAEALAQAEVVVVTGGLGPTLDDMTRHAVARAVERELEHSEEAWQGIRTWWTRRGIEIPAANRRQALVPAGAEVLPNEVGTAPGFAVEHGEARLYSLPGPPFEMKAMFEAQVAPRAAADRGRGGHGVQRLQRFHLYGVSESVFADSVGAWMERDANPLLGCSVKEGVLTASLRARGATEAEADQLLAERAAAFRERFGASIFSAGEDRVEQVVGRLLIERGVTVSFAESCTAGLACSLLGRVPGISAVLGTSFVTYSDAAKQEQLGVPGELLREHGAVSEPVAAALAEGAALRAGARAAVGISGIAGPGGGTPEKPVGLVCFATTLDGATRAETRQLPPTSRDHVRAVAARTALLLLWRRIQDEAPASR
ncbi:MAG: competence/damage-inducible protein A [Planctomycetota bacterium]